MRRREVEGGLCGLLLVAVVVGGLVTDRLVRPDEPVGAPWTPPSTAHPLGLDHLGRDLAARVLVGGGDLVLVCLLAGVLTGLIGAAVALCGWRYAPVAVLVDHVTTVALVLPGIVIVLLCAIFLGPDGAVVVVMLLLGVPVSARTISAALSSLRRSGFVEAALLRGERPGALLRREVLPGVAGAVVSDTGMRVIAALQLSLALQLIAPTDAVTWAAMVPAGLSGITLNPWAVVAPAAAIAIVAGAIAVGLDVVGDRWLPPPPRRRRGHRARTDRSDDLVVEQLAVHAADGREIVAVEHLVARPGEIIGVHGPSGSGKTTFLRALLGIVPHGCRLCGELGAPREVALVSQDQAAVLDPLQRVGAIVRDGRRNIKAEQVDAALTRMGLDPAVARRRPHGLSGGEAARVGLARALVGRPRMVLLDEPTSGLDGHSREVVIEALRELADEGAIIVLVSHDPDLLDRLAARSVGLGAVAEGPVRERAPGRVSQGGLGARDLRVAAPDGRVLLEGVDLEVSPGELVAVLGPSGSGKTTLGRVLAGLHPARGLVTLDGEPLSLDGWEWTPARPLRQRLEVQLIGQDPRSALNPAHPLRAQVRRAARARFIDPAAAGRAADEWLARLGVDEHVADRRPADCSGGQRQRAVVARALVVEPSVIIADEPTSALDSSSRELVLASLEQTCAGGGSVLVITHDPDVAARADRVLTLRDGTVTGAGRTRPRGDHRAG